MVTDAASDVAQELGQIARQAAHPQTVVLGTIRAVEAVVRQVRVVLVRFAHASATARPCTCRLRNRASCSCRCRWLPDGRAGSRAIPDSVAGRPVSAEEPGHPADRQSARYGVRYCDASGRPRCRRPPRPARFRGPLSFRCPAVRRGSCRVPRSVRSVKNSWSLYFRGRCRGTSESRRPDALQVRFAPRGLERRLAALRGRCRLTRDGHRQRRDGDDRDHHQQCENPLSHLTPRF